MFARDSHTCLFCDRPAVDAHHIIERRLWPDGGYYLENGASVCAEHHMACEQTTISVEDVRDRAGITRVVVPPHLYADQPYDKWGNPVLPNGTRLRGELFYDESVQKVLAAGGVLASFVDWVKYPRTHHVPWSPGLHSDDRLIDTMADFVGQRVVVTEKMDGENTTLYSDHMHARSVDARSHPSQSWVRGLHAKVAHEIPPGWRICGENLYAKHSIRYTALPTYFQGFSIWDERNRCLDWDETLLWFELLSFESVPVLYDGMYDERAIRAMEAEMDFQHSEGYVIRTAAGFDYSQFRRRMAKFVRCGHVNTIQHWRYGQPTVPNELEKD